jgi:hypothetical protein
LKNNAVRFLWCDGFDPAEYFVDDSLPRITGLAWIVNGPKQDQWAFELMLERPLPSREEVPWSTLLPAENETGWLSVDLTARHISVDPSRGRAA